MTMWEEMRNGKKILIGMVHCLPLPGTYGSETTIREVADRAVSDALCLEKAGFDALMIENEDRCNDTKMKKVQLAGLSMITYAVRCAVNLPIGICCGGLNYEEALSIAFVGGGSFVRLPVFVDTMLNYNGIIYPCSAKAVDYRKAIGAQHIGIMADIQVKHYYMLRPELKIGVSAGWAERQGADAIIVTGAGTGVETPFKDLEEVRKKVKIPVIVGSGVTEDNIGRQLELADAMIIGTCLREGGDMTEPIDQTKAAGIVKAAGR